MSGGRALQVFTLALAASSGCAATARHDPPPTKGAAANSCAAADSTTRSAIAGQLVGNYRLTMIATSGAHAGDSVTGTLAFDGRAGHALIALATVGAVAPGDIGSRDPHRPGVLLVSSPNDSSGTPMLRFGADANRSDIRAFDGAYLVMLVDAATTGGFSGRWRSGAGTAASGGYFCADRVSIPN